jgi:hypothetical protein
MHLPQRLETPLRRTAATLFATAVSAVLVVGVAALRAATGETREVLLQTGPLGLDWSLPAGFGAATLTVANPDGGVFTLRFAAGEPISLSLFDAKGAAMPDGTYNWELTASPRVRQRARREAEAARGIAGAERAPLGEGIRQSGSFSIVGGALVNPNQAETGNTARELLADDDLIVNDSACVGFDCAVGEAFGFDTIKLKENNLRIKFEDTSGAGFPGNDWQLTANDAAAGGQNKFSIEDVTGSRVPFTVEAAATNNSLYVDSTGRIGFRTTTPILDLHVKTGNTPALRFEQDASSGYGAWTWDIAGNETNFFIRDVTGGSRLPFRIRPEAPTSSLDIGASGDVGLGTASPAEKLHAFENANANSFVQMENPNGGDTALGGFRARADVATVNFQAHGSGRNLVRFGEDLGSWNEMLAVTGNGLILGTNNAAPLILGTNGASRMRIDAAGAVTVSGNFTVAGVKNFVMPDPADAQRAIYYASLEGPEAGTYLRGTAKLSEGEAVIALPGYFSRLTEAERMTVQLTPLGTWGQLYVVTKSPSQLVVRAAPGTADLEFDFLVQGIRKGYLDYQVERPITASQ